MKRLFGVVVFVGALAWVWAERTGYFDPKLEVLSLSCEATSPVDMLTVGTVENISEQPLQLKARVVVLSANRPQWSEGPVQPSPLPPGQTGEFRIPSRVSGGVDNSQIECRLDWFKDEAGRRLKYIHDEATTGGP